MEQFPFGDNDEKTAVSRSADTIGRGYTRNGSLGRDGSDYRSSKGISDPFALERANSAITDSWRETEDSLSVDRAEQKATDVFAINDEAVEGDFAHEASDGIGRDYRRNAALTRNGVFYRSSEEITDPFTSGGTLATMTDEWSVTDEATFGKRYSYSRNETYARNGSIVRKSGILFAA